MQTNRRALIVSVGASLAAQSLPQRVRAQAASEPRLIVAREAQAALLGPAAPPTSTLGYGGLPDGGVLRYRSGAEIWLRLANGLQQPTSLHLHGLRLPAAMSGVAGLLQEPVGPGASSECRFSPRDSGLSWFHPHAFPYTGEQLARGLYGVVIVEEQEPPLVDADVVAVVSDWRLDVKGAIIEDFGKGGLGRPEDAWQNGHTGSLVTLNSLPVPQIQTLAPGSRVRLRLVNAACARIMLLTFSGLKPMVLAIDGQPCEAFAPVADTIPIGPGARFDLMLDLPREPGAIGRMLLKGMEYVKGSPEPDRELLVFQTEGAPRLALPPIASLPQNPNLPAAIRLQDSLRVDLVLEGGGKSPFKINNQTSKDARGSGPLFTLKNGQPVTLGLINRTAFVQSIRVHGHHMRLLHPADDGWEPYWRDSILIPPGKTHHVAFNADNPGRWMLESPVVDHAANGMRTWFEVG